MSQPVPEDATDLINELRKKIKEYGKIPPPTKDMEFYEKIEILKTMYGIGYRRLANMLGIDKNKLASYHYRWRNKYYVEEKEEKTEKKEETIETSESEQIEPPTEAFEEESEDIPPILKQIILRYITMHFGKKVDKRIATEISEIISAGDIVKTKYQPACIEMGYMNLSTCVDNALNFYIKYKDKISEMENEIDNLRKTIDLITDFISNPENIREAVIRILDRWASELIYQGYPPDRVLNVYNRIKTYILSGETV